MTSRCVMIAPHEELAQLAEQVRLELDIPAKIVTSNTIPIAVEMAKKCVADGAKVIISRSTIARAISENVAIPVVPVEISFMDLVDTLIRVKKMRLGKRIALLIGPELGFDTTRIQTLLDIAVEHISVPRDGNMVDTISLIKKMDFDLVVGGAVAVYFAEAAGMRSVYFESGRESVRAAFVRARELLWLEEQAQLRDHTLRGILDHIQEGVLITNRDDEIVMLNAGAEKMLGVSRNSVVGKECKTALPFLPDRAPDRQSSDWCKVNGSPVLQNSSPYFRGSSREGAISVLYSAKLQDNLRYTENRELHLKGHVAHYSFANIITQSPPMLQVIARAKSFSQVDSTILITGETGTGKELFAQGIHNAGKRRNHPFVAINCASIPDSILESELFGYEAGAFTGAAKGGKKGFFEMAGGGTLFLDEIGEIAPNLQSKLLRVLEQREIVRVGGDRVIPVNIRIIVATLADMEAEVRNGSFRRDLYYRLNILRLSIPPLRERPGDLPPLIEALSAQTAERLGLPKLELDAAVLERFATYPWYGNVRELVNALERLTILQEEKKIDGDELDAILEDMRRQSPDRASPPQTMAEIEKKAIMDAMERFNGDKGKICDALAISQSTLWRRLKDWGIQVE